MFVKNNILEENRKRNELINAHYDPLSGYGSTSIERVSVYIEGAPLEDMYLPVDFANTPLVSLMSENGFESFITDVLQIEFNDDNIEETWRAFIRERVKYDFEYWAYSFIKIKAKGKPYDIQFSLNRAQRYLLGILERMRLDGVPIEIILLKARQWGGSTLIQFYMLWIQLVHRNNWNSVICGDVEGQSRNVRGMVTKALASYPDWLLNDQIKFTPFEGSSKNRVIENTNCVISIGSAQKPDTLRSSDISMAHLTEVGLWKATKEKKPEDLIQSIIGSLYETEYSFLALESTAKGVGNYFHREYIKAEKGENNLTPVFIPWFMIDIYSNPIEDYNTFFDEMDDKEWMLWEMGATLEAINWYRKKRKTMAEWRLNSEYPSTALEAFQSTGRRIFRMEDVRKLEKSCLDPEFKGELVGMADTGPDSLIGMRFVQGKGDLKVWMMPDSEKIRDRYIVVVDIGGVSDQADYSDIVVFDRYFMMEGGVPDIAAEWHGHIDHDKVAWKAAQIATMYGEALLVIESNTLETEGTEGDNFEYILDEIAGHYDNLYSRTPIDQIRQGAPKRWGFHTNSSTKPMVIKHHVKAVRDGLYIERDQQAIFEHDTFELKEDGKTMGAVEGMHDDKLMTRAIGVWVCYHWDLPRPAIVSQAKSPRIISEASI